MKKLLLLFAVMLSTVGAWAQMEKEHTLDCNNGTGVSSSGWSSKWTSTQIPTLTLSTGANNIKDVDNDKSLCLYAGDSKNATYTLQVPSGYKISWYEFDYVFSRNTNETSADNLVLTANGTDYTVSTETADTVSLRVEGVNAQNTTFRLRGVNHGIKTTNFKVYVVEDSPLPSFVKTSTEESPIYYVIASYNRGGVLTSQGNGASFVHEAQTDGSYWFFESANDNGGVYMVNKQKDGDNKLYANHEYKVSTTPAVWYVLRNGVNENGVVLSKTNPISSGSCVDASKNNNSVGSWDPSSGDWDGTTWVIGDVDFDAVYNPNNVVLRTRSDRKINSVQLNGSSLNEFAPANTTSITHDAYNPFGKAYVDLTDRVTMRAAAGETLTAVINSHKDWVNAYLYIDKDNNGFTASVDADGYTPLEDLITFSNLEGKNSQGTTSNGNTKVMPSFNAPTTPGTYRMRFKIDWSSIDPNGGNANFYTDGGTIVDVNLEVRSVVDVKYVFMYDGKKIGEETRVGSVGLEFPSITYSLPYGITATKPEGILQESDVVGGIVTKEIVLVNNLPFVYAEDVASIRCWYTMDVHGNENTYAVRSAENNIRVAVTAAALYQNGHVPDNSYMWAFVGNPWDGFKIINKAAGLDVSLYQPSDDDVEVSLHTDGQLFKVHSSSQISNAICFKIDGRNYYPNHRSDKIQGWTANDAGSSFRIYPVIDGKILTTDQTMTNGKYYRIQSSARKTLLGIDGYTFNMKNSAYNLDNAGQIWKYVQEDGKAYLQNVYSGLYPQAVPSGGGNTTHIGSNKDKAFTYSKHGQEEKIWNIYFGGTQVNIEANGNVNYWFGDNAHHCIYEIEATDEEVAEMCVNWYNANPCDGAACGYEKIDLIEGAEVISPNEFVAPSEINSLIDELSLTGEITLNNIHELFSSKIKDQRLVNYKNAVASNGDLLSVDYKPKAEWGTIILPINWSNPDGWTRYSCAATEGNVLTLAEYAAGATKNAPMIIQVEEDKIGTTYQFIGYSNGAATTNQTAGLLTGVLEDNTKVPAGSYVLARQKSTGIIGFFPVAEGADYGLEKHKCYLTLPVESARYNALFFEGGETAIENVEGAESAAKAVVYDLAGRRVQNAQKGVFIVNGKVVIK